MRIRHTALILSILSVFALGACGSSQPSDTSAVAGEQTKAFAPAAQDGHYHAELVLAGQPAVTADGKDIVVTVNVSNDGVGAFGSATEPHNVNLGAHAVDATGNVVINDLARGHLPQIASGATEKASILLPVSQALSLRVELLPVQEGVNWFDAWGTKPLVVGPFNVCSDAAVGQVCDASGKPLRAAPVQP